jgi:outer membrane protein OmpA-like peptidoglycan-associated protein
MAYVRFAQGYESGGFAGFATGNEFNPETNNEYEIGAKTDWLNKRLRVNLDFFDNELSNLQVESALAVPPPQLFLQETLNAGSATVEGMEAQIIAVPTENLTTHLNVGYLHTKFNQNYSTTCSNTAAPADCSGLHFAMAPKWTLALGSDYVQDLPNEWGTATFSAEWDYKSGLYTADPVYPSSYQPGYGLVNLSVTLADPSDKYAIEFYGTNVLNRHYASGYTDPSGLTAWFKQGEPAMWGLKITAKFGPFRSEEPPAPVPAPPPEAPVAPPAPVVKAPEAARQFQVFFDFDKSDITSAAAQVIEAAAEAVKAGNVVRLTVTGHTDTVGSAKYNQALSERRAAAVKGQLVSDGVASGEITATGVGKTGLLVPTADGVREPQNRRAEIVLQ